MSADSLRRYVAGRRTRHFALSAVEVIVGIVILGVIAALAIPQFSQAAGRNRDNELRLSLSLLRTAIEMYHQEHSAYPGAFLPTSHNTKLDAATVFVSQLTLRSDKFGRFSVKASPEFPFGPYLRSGIPPQPLAAGASANRVAVVRGPQPPRFDDSLSDTAWVYNADTGYICANAAGKDEAGVRYDQY